MKGLARILAVVAGCGCFCQNKRVYSEYSKVHVMMINGTPVEYWSNQYSGTPYSDYGVTCETYLIRSTPSIPYTLVFVRKQKILVPNWFCRINSRLQYYPYPCTSSNLEVVSQFLTLSSTSFCSHQCVYPRLLTTGVLSGVFTKQKQKEKKGKWMKDRKEERMQDAAEADRFGIPSEVLGSD